MAIISSVALGKVRKSLGNVTLQHYYGKTVAKQKIVRNPQYVPSTQQEEQRARMYYVFHFLNAWDGLSDLLFVRSKWGTKRNNFVKLNYPAIAEYVKDHSTLNIPQSGHFNNLIYLMASEFTAYNKPVYVAKGVDASVLCWAASTGAYASGKTPIGAYLTVVDAMYKKVRARLLYFVCTSAVAPYDGQASMQVSAWNDLTLTNGTWTMPQIDIEIEHTVPVSCGYIFQIMIDDVPVTINASGITQSESKPVQILTLGV